MFRCGCFSLILPHVSIFSLHNLGRCLADRYQNGDIKGLNKFISDEKQTQLRNLAFGQKNEIHDFWANLHGKWPTDRIGTNFVWLGIPIPNPGIPAHFLNPKSRDWHWSNPRFRDYKNCIFHADKFKFGAYFCHNFVHFEMFMCFHLL